MPIPSLFCIANDEFKLCVISLNGLWKVFRLSAQAVAARVCSQSDLCRCLENATNTHLRTYPLLSISDLPMDTPNSLTSGWSFMHLEGCVAQPLLVA